MDNKEILIVSQCKKDVTEIRKLNNEQENLNKICSDYEFDAEDAADNTSIIAILVGIIAIIVLIVIGVFWLLAIVLGCVIGFIVDLPFKLLRITFFKLRYVIKRSNITRRTKKIQKELSQISNSKEILYVKSIIGDNCYKEECLDFIMDEMNGNQVVQNIRVFDKNLYILLLTGHKDLAPPLQTLKELDIQGYCEKSDNLNQLVLLVESALKSVDQMRIINQINEELAEKNVELEQAYLDTVKILRQTVEAKDPYTRGHSDRVSAFAVLLGKKLGLGENDLETLRVGGLFHDIGKIGIPDNVLTKDDRLTENEFSQIKEHPTIGAHILGNAKVFQDIIPIVKHHHERYDGHGYPSNLVGEDIPYLVRIVTVVDTFDAMTSKRSYRDAMPLDVVIAEIKKCSGTQFDPKCAEAFLDILENEYDKIEEIRNKYKG